MSRNLVVMALLLATGVLLADDVPEAERLPAASEAKAKAGDDAKLIDGMSVLGNREAPKSLVIVPWKSSEIGDTLGVSPLLDDSRQPIDKEVFLRALRYYEIQHGSRDGAAAADEKVVD